MLVQQCEELDVRFALVSDERTTLLMQRKSQPWEGKPTTFLSLVRNQDRQITVRKSLAFLVHHEAVQSRCTSFERPHSTLTLGPLPNDALMKAMVATQGHRLLDFDRLSAEMAADPRGWNHVAYWKDAASIHARLHPLARGDILHGEVGSFFRYNILWRSPYPSHALSAEDLAFLTRYPRPKDPFTTSLLAEDGAIVTFKVTRTVKIG